MLPLLADRASSRSLSANECDPHKPGSRHLRAWLTPHGKPKQVTDWKFQMYVGKTVSS